MTVSLSKPESSFCHRVMQQERALFGHLWSPEEQAQLLKGSESKALLMIRSQSGEEIGYFILQVVAPEVEIISFVIFREYRNQAWGFFSLQALFDWCYQRRYEVVFLEVRPSNTPAVLVYKKAGLSTIGVRKQYYQDGEDALLMRVDLEVSGES